MTQPRWKPNPPGVVNLTVDIPGGQLRVERDVEGFWGITWIDDEAAWLVAAWNEHKPMPKFFRELFPPLASDADAIESQLDTAIDSAVEPEEEGTHTA